MNATFPVAVHMFLIKDDKLLLLKRDNTGYEDGNFSVVAGHIEHGESASQAAIRETLEEVGVIIKADQLKFFGVMHRKSNDERVDYFLSVEKWDGVPRILEPDKCSALYWCDMNSLPENTIPYIRKAIETFIDKKNQTWFQEFGW